MARTALSPLRRGDHRPGHKPPRGRADLCRLLPHIEEMEDAGFEPTMPLSEWHLIKEVNHG